MSRPPPIWTAKLLGQAAIEMGSRGYTVRPVVLSWFRTKRHSSSGTCFKDHIHVSAGTDRTDQKMVLLHEFAHWLHPEESHSPAYWDTCWYLYRWAKLPIRHCLRRSANYRKESVNAYKRMRGTK